MAFLWASRVNGLIHVNSRRDLFTFSQLTFNCSKSTTETKEKSLEYVQTQQKKPPERSH